MNTQTAFMEDAADKLIQKKLRFMYKHVTTWSGLDRAIRQRETIITMLLASPRLDLFLRHSVLDNWNTLLANWKKFRAVLGKEDRVFEYGVLNIMVRGDEAIVILLNRTPREVFQPSVAFLRPFIESQQRRGTSK